MKTKQSILSVLTSIVTLFLLILARLELKFCKAVYAFESSSPLIYGFIILLRITVIWVSGFLLFFYLSKRRSINVFIYFSLLTVVSSWTIIANIFKDVIDSEKEIKYKICSKSSLEGFEYEMKNLTVKEYEFLTANKSWLPKVHPKSKFISIKYYNSDDITGDYELDIKIEISKEYHLDTIKFPEWKLIDSLNQNTLVYHHNQFSM